MTHHEAKSILLRYRPGTTDASDPDVAAALGLVRGDAELARWLDEQGVVQEALRSKFRNLAAPAGLKEQILSEVPVISRSGWSRPVRQLAAAAAFLLIVTAFAWFYLRPTPDDRFANYRTRMVSAALRGYQMDLTADNPAQIRKYLQDCRAPADYTLPNGLAKAMLVGCAVQNWQEQKVSMVCFRTGKPLPPGEASDLWLFVIDRRSLKDCPESVQPLLARVNRLMTATWIEDGKVYLLGLEGDETALRQYL